MRISTLFPGALMRPMALAAGVALLASGATAAPAIAASPGGASSPVAGLHDDRATVSGTVKAPKGANPSKVWVSLVRSYNQASSSGDAITAKGRFDAFVRTGKFTGKIAVNRDSAESKYIGGFWTGNGKKISPVISKGKTITVGTKNVTGITPVLTTCATVSGTVKYGDKNTKVQVFNDNDQRLVTRFDKSIGSNGKFTVRGLIPGKYWMVAFQGNGGDQVAWRYFGTNSAKMPSKPNLVIKSCTNIKDKNITGKKNIIKVTKRATLSGTPAVGRVLTASKPAFKPGAVKVTYQWYRDNNTRIPGATGRSHRAQAADFDGYLSVRIVARKKGYSLASTTTYSSRVR